MANDRQVENKDWLEHYYTHTRLSLSLKHTYACHMSERSGLPHEMKADPAQLHTGVIQSTRFSIKVTSLLSLVFGLEGPR